MLTVAASAMADETNISAVFSKTISSNEVLEIVCECWSLPSSNHNSANIPQGDNDIDEKTGLPKHHTISFSSPLEKSNYMERAQAYSLAQKEAYAKDELPIHTSVGFNPEAAHFYFPVLHKGDQSTTNHDYGFQMNLSRYDNRQDKISIVDVDFEPGVVVYLYRVEPLSYYGATCLFLTQVFRSPDGQTFQRKDRLLWRALEGDFSEIKSARLAGNYEQGTLCVEVDLT